VALQVTGRTRIRVLLIVAATTAGLAVLLWARGRSGSEPSAVNLNRAEPVTGSISDTPPSNSPALSPVPSVTTSSSSLTPTPGALNTESTPATENNGTLNDPAHTGAFVFTPNLIVPVVGVRSDQLQDTFWQARSEGRVHDAIDIPAPAGTPVVATADGEIIKLFQSDRGGTTIYQLSADRRFVFYYAHLQRYADGLVVGKFAKQGEVIGYVGDTGNAGAGNFHLHFSLAIIADPKRYWEGTNINPYPLLRK
jgi:murein DD-endopeptidase MepM/ murein hydrolase activator NlpD